MHRLRGAATALVLVSAPGCSSAQVARATPQAVVDELLAADRAFAAAAAQTDVVTGLSAMFAADVTFAVPGERFAEGREAAVLALQGNPENAGSRVSWAPIRGGVSADARHGFTFGYMAQQRPDGSSVPLKYLAYWVRQPEGWRVLVYRRRTAPAGEPARALMPPALPPRLVAPTTDANTIARMHASLDSAERAFSADAQTIGLAAAFARHGSADAVNMGGPNDVGFVVGAEAIGRSVGAGTPTSSSPLSWAPERVIVASSGDLGVTIGTIRRNAPAEPARPSSFPFFTIWRRTGPNERWRYIAE